MKYLKLYENFSIDVDEENDSGYNLVYNHPEGERILDLLSGLGTEEKPLEKYINTGRFPNSVFYMSDKQIMIEFVNVNAKYGVKDGEIKTYWDDITVSQKLQKDLYEIGFEHKYGDDDVSAIILWYLDMVYDIKIPVKSESDEHKDVKVEQIPGVYMVGGLHYGDWMDTTSVTKSRYGTFPNFGNHPEH